MINSDRSLSPQIRACLSIHCASYTQICNVCIYCANYPPQCIFCKSRPRICFSFSKTLSFIPLFLLIVCMNEFCKNTTDIMCNGSSLSSQKLYLSGFTSLNKFIDFCIIFVDTDLPTLFFKSLIFSTIETHSIVVSQSQLQ